MSTLAGLLMPSFAPADIGQAMNRGILGGSQLVSGQTALLALQEEKQKQQSMQMVYEAIQRDPALAQQLLGGSVLGSLGPAGGLPAPGGPQPGPITQRPLGGGPAQTIPAYPDASQFATQGGPDQRPRGFAPEGAQPQQSLLASLGPAGQPQMQAPQRNPVLEMAATNPRAAMLMQQQMEGRQDQQMKRHEQNLKLGAATLGYVGQQAQGVTDQASLDALRSDLQSQGLGKYAAQLPQLYSKEAMQPFIARATDVEKSLTLQVQGIQAQAELKRAQMSGRVATTDQYLKALGVTPGTEQPEDMQRAIELQNRHLAEIEAGKVNAQIVPGPGGEYWMVNPRTGERRPVGGGEGAAGTGTGGAGTGEQLRAPMTEAQSKTAVYTDTMKTGNDTLNALEKSGDYATWKLPLTNLPGGHLALSDKQKDYETAKGVFLTGLLRYQSAGQITKEEWKEYGDLYFPVAGDSPERVAAKQRYRNAAIKTMGAALGRPLPGQEQGNQAQPQGQGSTGTSQGPATFDRADFLKWRQGAGKSGNPTQADVEAYFQAKGLKRR